jgi:DNA-binding MarR family transcriptional regulator
MTPSGRGPTPDLSYLLNHTSHVLATQMTAALAEIGISPRAFCVLSHAMAAERTQIQLAELADLDKTTMVGTIDELERAGLAERRPASTDRRARIIAVTEAGEQMAAEGRKIVDGVHRGALNAVPAAERDALVSALTLLAAGHLAKPADCDHPVRRPRQAHR